MKTTTKAIMAIGIVLAFMVTIHSAQAAEKKLNVVTTLPDYAWITQQLGGDLVSVRHIVNGDEDPHFVRPKPSFAAWLASADLLITTGLDLELWLPSLIDKSGNPKIREGQIGYVAVSDGIKLKEIPTTFDRSQGGVHIYGNPHITTSPTNIKIIATNIAIGLAKVDPDHKSIFQKNLKKFKQEIDNRLFGERLVKLLGGDTLCKLADSGNLIPFLEKKSFRGKKLIELLGGWMKRAYPLRGKKLITYHKNWVYFTDLIGFVVVGQVEPKPAIPPSPKDVEKLINLMKKDDVKVVFAANFYDQHKVRKICAAVGAHPVIVPMFVGGVPEVKSYFDLFDYWLDHLLEAYKSIQ